ncbi:GntR family transcriptional regulator [Aureimonas populi]|uniref:GntR family transcriptional regulator n=1 Tax=Aureimonas populi TaxID=1701758 RepID=A0ABW5CMX4_9HYPH|nr:GntR family transcriptional regulator [Aureimonas populi]
MSSEADGQGGSQLADQAYRHILNAILSGRMPAGTPVQERRLASQLGVSRSPMRDALGRLAGEGLVVRGNTGALTVRAISLRDYLQSLDMRMLVEPSAAALCAESLDAGDLRRLAAALAAIEAAPDAAPEARLAFDDDLHETIARRCGNPFMERTLREMRRYTTIYERQAGRIGASQADAKEHGAILESLAERSSAGARRAMEQHLKAIRERVLQEF